MGKTAEDVRQEVSKSYGEAISRPAAGGCRSAGLIDVEVRGRLVFDVVQILSAVKVAADEFRLDEMWNARAEELAKTVEGKVWSAKVYRRKPA